uniref:Chemosensory protein 7 n=1 Tax=Dendrolimus punctatus TaxID=238572 RepID=A0A2K8GL09_9NEOP|nr:Chemosensory protein 7 [Dendrolimus punctatus]
MKGFIAVCVLSLAAAVLSDCPEGLYTDRYDTTNVQEIVTNDRLLNPYVSCIMEEGKCTPEGKELKSHIAHALQTGCECCTETQKDKSRVVIGHFINEKPDVWDKLTAKYDPTRKFSKKYEEELRKLKA